MFQKMITTGRLVTGRTYQSQNCVKSIVRTTRSFVARRQPSISMISRTLCASSVPIDEPNKSNNNNSKVNRLVVYSQLAKFRLSSLVVLTSGAGYLCYGSAIDPTTLIGE